MPIFIELLKKYILLFFQMNYVMIFKIRFKKIPNISWHLNIGLGRIHMFTSSPAKVLDAITSKVAGTSQNHRGIRKGYYSSDWIYVI